VKPRLINVYCLKSSFDALYNMWSGNGSAFGAKDSSVWFLRPQRSVTFLFGAPCINLPTYLKDLCLSPRELQVYKNDKNKRQEWNADVEFSPCWLHCTQMMQTSGNLSRPLTADRSAAGCCARKWLLRIRPVCSYISNALRTRSQGQPI